MIEGKYFTTNISLNPALTNCAGGTGTFISGKTHKIELTKLLVLGNSRTR